MSLARACAGVVALAVGITTLEIPEAQAGPPTGTPAVNPAHPVWRSNEALQPRTKVKATREHTSTKGTARPETNRRPEEDLIHEVMPLHPPTSHHTDPLHTDTPSASPTQRPPEALDGSIDRERHQRAEQAYQEALRKVAEGELNEAIEQLDMATELDPKWSAPVALRAETFGTLATRHAPSEAFLSAQAADLQRLLALEPNVEVAQRSQKLIELRGRSQEAQRQEARRRKMVKPALIVGTFSVALIVGGVFLAAGVYPSTGIDEFRQRSMVYGGIVMTAVGVATAPVSISLGVLAGRQAKRDQVVREMNAYTGRPQPTLGMSPRLFPGGGGLGFNLRF